MYFIIDEHDLKIKETTYGKYSFYWIIIVIVGVCAPLFYRLRINNDASKLTIVLDAYLINTIFLYLVADLIYSSEFNSTIIWVGLLVLWAIYKLILRTKRGKELEKDPRFYRALALPAPFVGIIIELYLFFGKSFGEYGFIANQLQFKILATLSILFLIWTLYFNTKSFKYFIFNERDGFRKVFIAEEVMVIIVYAAFTVFYVFNTNLLPFFHYCDVWIFDR